MLIQESAAGPTARQESSAANKDAATASAACRKRAHHVPLRLRTSDPEALAWDEAVQMFRSGLAHCRAGDFHQGTPKIACAYLMDTRAVLFMPTLPDEEAGLSFIDMPLLEQLLEYDRSDSYASQVLMVYVAILFSSAQDGDSKKRVLQALFESSKLLNNLYNDQTLENRGLGTFKRTTVHKLRSTLYLSIWDMPKAAKELTDALQINPRLAGLRFTRACLLAVEPGANYEVLYKEFLQVVEDSHPDARELREAYAWIAKLSMDHGFGGGTEASVEMYVQKSVIAAARCRELYGVQTKSSIEEEMELSFHGRRSKPQWDGLESREDDIAVPQTRRLVTLTQVEQVSQRPACGRTLFMNILTDPSNTY